MTTVKNIYDYINSIAPYDTQEEWDNSGHILGDFRAEVKKAVMALDATRQTALFAKETGAQLVLTHHPVIFGSISNVKTGTAVYDFVSNKINVLCAHTNFDKAQGGINESLAQILELENIQRLEDGFTVAGDLKCEMSADDFVQLVSDRLYCQGIRYTDSDRIIKKIALCGGAGGDFIETAMANADCYLTGELKYHEMLECAEKGFCAISAGHFETENSAFLMLKEKLEKIFTDVEFIVAPNENPVHSI